MHSWWYSHPSDTYFPRSRFFKSLGKKFFFRGCTLLIDLKNIQNFQIFRIWVWGYLLGHWGHLHSKKFPRAPCVRSTRAWISGPRIWNVIWGPRISYIYRPIGLKFFVEKLKVIRLGGFFTELHDSHSLRRYGTSNSAQVEVWLFFDLTKNRCFVDSKDIFCQLLKSIS